MKKGDKVYFEYQGEQISGFLMSDPLYSDDVVVATQTHGILSINKRELRSAPSFTDVFKDIFPWAK